ncbi:hypothetical protein [Nocardioides ultimimeridianus]
MHARVYLLFRAFWLLAAVALLLLWLHMHDLPHHQYRSFAVATMFLWSLLMIWRPDGRFGTRRAKGR